MSGNSPRTERLSHWFVQELPNGTFRVTESGESLSGRLGCMAPGALLISLCFGWPALQHGPQIARRFWQAGPVGGNWAAAAVQFGWLLVLLLMLLIALLMLLGFLGALSGREEWRVGYNVIEVREPILGWSRIHRYTSAALKLESAGDDDWRLVVEASGSTHELTEDKREPVLALGHRLSQRTGWPLRDV